MSEQILLQGKILGIEEFLLSRPGGATPARSNGEELLAGRSQWITLLCEVLPRALLAEFSANMAKKLAEQTAPVPLARDGEGEE